MSPLGVTASLSIEQVEKLHRSVAMMGAEPIIKALAGGAEVIIAGRATDASLFAAYPLYKNIGSRLCLACG